MAYKKKKPAHRKNPKRVAAGKKAAKTRARNKKHRHSKKAKGRGKKKGKHGLRSARPVHAKRLSKVQRRRHAARSRRDRDPWNPKGLSGQAAADAQLAWARSKGNHSVSAIKVVDGQWYRKYGKNKHWDNGLSDSGFEYRNGKMYSVATGEMDSPSNYSYEYID